MRGEGSPVPARRGRRHQTLGVSASVRTWCVELVALSIVVQQVVVLALALRSEVRVVEREDVAVGTGSLSVQLEAAPGRLIVVHALKGVSPS